MDAVEVNAVFEWAGEGKPNPSQQWNINGQAVECRTFTNTYVKRHVIKEVSV